MFIDLQWDIKAPSDAGDIENRLNQVAEACFKVEGIEGVMMAVRVTDDAGIRELNRTMRSNDTVTDVLSFPTVTFPEGKTAKDCPKRLKREYDPYTGFINLGDCVVNLDRARAQAKQYGHSEERELCYLVAHSAFHLMGYDHMNPQEKAKMRDREEVALGSLGILRIDYDDLFERACKASEMAYCPYSHFRVGACLLSSDGRKFTGCNFENASYGATICAERCAVGSAIAGGARRFAAIAIAGATAPAWPCGICRQVLSEFANQDMPVIVGTCGGDYAVRTLGELLPESFKTEYVMRNA